MLMIKINLLLEIVLTDTKNKNKETYKNNKKKLVVVKPYISAPPKI